MSIKGLSCRLTKKLLCYVINQDHKWSINVPCPFLNEYTHYTGVCIIFNAFRFWNGSYCPSYKGIAELFAFARALRVYKETLLVQTRCACTCLYCCQKKLLVDLRRGWKGRGGGCVEIHVNCMFQISSWCHYYDFKLEIMKGYDIDRINRR